jgi:hypothetical protein
MLSRFAADLVLTLHLVFILFVVAGALLVMRWPRIAWLHLPAAAWGTFVEVTGRICPLTTLENHFRRAAGFDGYADSFVEHYFVPIIYPAGLTRDIQWWLAAVVVAVNLVCYSYILNRRRKTRITDRPQH